MCKTKAQTAMTVQKAVTAKIQTLPRFQIRQKTQLYQLINFPKTQDTEPSNRHRNHKSLGGLVDNPLGFGPVDRGSIPHPCTSFLK